MFLLFFGFLPSVNPHETVVLFSDPASLAAWWRQLDAASDDDCPDDATSADATSADDSSADATSSDASSAEGGLEGLEGEEESRGNGEGGEADAEAEEAIGKLARELEEAVDAAVGTSDRGYGRWVEKLFFSNVEVCQIC